MQIQQNEEYLFTGNIDILNELKKIFVLYSSREIPRQYNKEYDNFYRTLMEQNLVFAGGWHSPLEKEIFNWWKKKKPCPLIYFASRSLPQSKDYFSNLFKNIDPQKYLIIDPNISSPRISKNTVLKRDEFILKLFDNFIFTFIQSGGSCEKLLEKTENLNKNIFLFNHISNEIYSNDHITMIDPFTLDILKCI